jgi:AraC-like DNA-binding protein
MPSLPLPFFTSFFLFFILLKVTFSNGHKISVLPLFAIGSYGLQSALLGLIWGYKVTFSLPLLAAFATLIPPLTYAALTSMVTTTTNARIAWLLGPAFGIALFVLFIPWMNLPILDDMLDFIIVGVYLFYGGLMIWIAMSMETEWMDQLPFQRLISANRTFVVAGAAMLLSAAIDMIVFYDLISNGGNIAPEVVSLSNLMLLVALGISVLRMSGAAPSADPSRETPIKDVQTAKLSMDEVLEDGMTREELLAQQTATLTQLDAYMLEHRIYRDENLSLDRLARRTLIPSRQISLVINNLRALNVPQYVNTFRIIEACERLKKTDAPITEIIYDVGFTTKSNFNREFQRIVGVSPSAWRRSNDFDNRPSDWPFVMDFIKSTTALRADFSLHSAEEST